LSNIEEVKKQRFQFIRKLWQITSGDQSKRVLVRQIAEPLRLNENDARIIVQYLSGEELLDITSHGFNIPSYLDASLYIKHKGVIEVEQALSKPESPTAHFPASVVNYINVGTMTNSNIAQASSDTNQTITLSPDAKQNISEIINMLKEFLDKQEIQQEKRDELRSDISTIASQLDSPKPKVGILSASLSSAKSILESVSTIAVTVAPVVAQISSVLAMIR
jgi:hypothetical protein